MRAITAYEDRARQLASKIKDPKKRERVYLALLKSYQTIVAIMAIPDEEYPTDLPNR